MEHCANAMEKYGDHLARVEGLPDAAGSLSDGRVRCMVKIERKMRKEEPSKEAPSR